MRQRRLMNEINVVPYIDVMLVLLVIFMVTAPLLTPGVVDLPSVGKSAQAPEAPLEVVIRADGAIALRDRARANAPDRAVTLDQLASAVARAQGRNTARAVVIGADREVRYERVMQVMDRLQRANIRRVGLLVKPAE